jgi:hypothetical protein
MPKPLQPMLATLIDAPFDDPDWMFESKWDGFRLVAKIEANDQGLNFVLRGRADDHVADLDAREQAGQRSRYPGPNRPLRRRRVQQA